MHYTSRPFRNSRFASVMALSMLAACSITAAGTATDENPEGVSAPRDPVKYKVKEKSLIGNDLHEAGAIVNYAGLPSENLEPTCDEGRKRAAEYKESNTQRVSLMVENNRESAVGDPAKFMAQFTKQLAEERAEHQAQMAKMLEIQQESALQLAQASANMADLAKAIAGMAPAAAPAPAETPTGTDSTEGAAPAKRKG